MIFNSGVVKRLPDPPQSSIYSHKFLDMNSSSMLVESSSPEAAAVEDKSQQKDTQYQEPSSSSIANSASPLRYLTNEAVTATKELAEKLPADESNNTRCQNVGVQSDLTMAALSAQLSRFAQPVAVEVKRGQKKLSCEDDLIISGEGIPLVKTASDESKPPAITRGDKSVGVYPLSQVY